MLAASQNSATERKRDNEKQKYFWFSANQDSQSFADDDFDAEHVYQRQASRRNRKYNAS